MRKSVRKPRILFYFKIFHEDQFGCRPIGHNWAESKKKAVSNFSWRRQGNLCRDDVPGRLIAKPVPGVAPRQIWEELIVSPQPQEIPRLRCRQLVFEEFRNPIF